VPVVARRGVELMLVVLGLAFVGAETDAVLLLAVWDLVALFYVVAGGVVLRVSGFRAAGPGPSPRADRWRRPLDVTFAAVAAATGLATAVVVAVGDLDDADAEAAIRLLGGVAIVLSWLLLHAGFARRYRSLYWLAGGLAFPTEAPSGAVPAAGTAASSGLVPAAVAESPPVRPRVVDFYYFAYSLATSFGATDVLVTTTRMRWNVTVHTVVAFFFNAAVVAFAINVFSSS
jgi:uncharacterized membrane protein